MSVQNDVMGERLASRDEPPLIVIASNRGPFSFKQKENGEITYQRGSGGLVTALGALAEKHEVLWVAAALSKGDRAWAEQHASQPAEVDGILLKLVQPSSRRYDQYYNVIANPLLWFVQHQLWDIPRTPSITRDTWKAWRNGYVAVNRLFAEEIADIVKDAQRPVIVFPQDYHLYLVPHRFNHLCISPGPARMRGASCRTRCAVRS
jgi:trehalose 6-phosphate synthase